MIRVEEYRPNRALQPMPHPAPFEGVLAPGERVVWTDRPSPMRLAAKRVPKALMGALLIALALVLVAWRPADASGSSLLIVAPLVLIGAGAMLSPGWAYWQARATTYAVTSERLLILTTAPRRRLRSYGPADIGTVERYGDNREGDVVFNRARLSHRLNRMAVEPAGFFGIPDALTVADAIAALKARAAT